MSKIIAYHGSKDSFNQAGVDHSHGKTSNIGLYLSDSKDIARTYAGRTGYVYEIELSLNNPMVVDFEGVNWDSFDYDGTATSYFILDSEGNELGWYSNLPDAEFAESDFDEPVKIVKDVDPEKTWSTDDIARNAKREGHDSVIIENVIDSADKSVREPSTVYVVFDNDCIVNTRLVSESLSESFIGFVKSLDRGWNKSLIEAIVEGYKVIFESESSNDNLLRWFDDSKVVDESGKPLIVYHGTNASPFNTFVGKWNVRFEEERGTIYFTDDKDIAGGYGSSIYACYLKMLNPLVYDAKGLHWTTVNWYALSDALSGGHDGVILKNVLDTPAGREERTINTYIVFDSSQIKSATENNGNYNPRSRKIFESNEYSGVTLYNGTNAITITGEHLMESDHKDDLQSLFDELSEFVDSNPDIKPSEPSEPEKTQIKDGGTVVAYHGSNAVFNEFSKEKIGTNFSNTKDGFFFSDDLEYVDYLAKKLSKEKGGTPTLYKCQLDLGRTYTARNYFDTFSESEADKMYAATQGDVIDIFDSYRDDIISKARSNKCNSIHFHSAGVHLYVVFESNQIKILSRSSLTESLTESISDYSDIINGHTIPELVHYDWNKIAFGFSNDDVINIPLSKLKIKWKQDMENVIGFDMKEYFDNIPYDSLPPIEASFDGKNFYVEDGHHRYGYAKQLKLKNVPVVVEITANPFKKLGFDIDDVVEYKTGKL